MANRRICPRLSTEVAKRIGFELPVFKPMCLWRAALVVFFNYGVDTGTVFGSAGFHEPILWRHVSWRPEPPNGQGKECRYGWLYYRRVKTNKQFHRPMNRVVHAHLKSIRPETPQPDEPVFAGRASRPNKQFQLLCALAGVKPKQDVETGEEKLWVSKDLENLRQRTTMNICRNRRLRFWVTRSAASRIGTTPIGTRSHSKRS